MKKCLLEQSTNPTSIEKLICFELNVENECQRKVTLKQESPSFSLGKCQKGTLTFTFFFLSLLCSWTKICQSQQSIICWWKSVLTKNFPTTFTSRAQTFPLLIPIWIWQGVGVRMERGCAAGYPSGMSHPVKEPSAARSNLLPECLDLGSPCLARWN